MTRVARATMVAVAFATLAACTRVGAPSPDPQWTSVDATSSPVAAASDELPMEATLSPDQFWSQLFSGDPAAINYPTLADMVKDSDLIVLGSMAGVSPGPDSVAGQSLTNYMLTVTVHVDRVIYGKMPDGTATVPVAVFLGVGPTDEQNPYAPQIANRAASIPMERGVFVLQNLAAYYGRFDPTASERYDPTVYQVASLQGLIRDDAGTAWVSDQAPGDWAASIAGRPFSTALAETTAAAAAATE